MKWLMSFWTWLAAVAVVAVITLALSAHTPSTVARIAHLETLVKCPSCQDLSVAQSSSTSSLAVRAQITSLVKAGKSDGQILATIESSYGPSVLLSPSTSGLGALLWLGPVGVIGVLVGTTVMVRRRR